MGPQSSGRLETSQLLPTPTAMPCTASLEMESSALTPPEAVDLATVTLVAHERLHLRILPARYRRDPQVGIVSFGSSSGCETGLPAGFTRTEYYLDWIKSETGMP